MSLQIQYRPKTFNDFFGNNSSINSLTCAIDREQKNQIFLFTGITGLGKTSLAYILKEEYNCNDIDFFYYNAANTRGIDTIRDITINSKLAPIANVYKMYVMDECFSKETLVNTPNGKKKISDIKVGDNIDNIIGIDTVKHVFKNKVKLSRVCCIRLSTGINIFCSKDHLFLTENGWVPAKNLDTSCFLCYMSDNKINNILPVLHKEQRYDKIKRKYKQLYELWEKTWGTTIQLFLPTLQQTIYRENLECQSLSEMQNNSICLPILWERILYKKNNESTSDMFQKLSTKIKTTILRISSKSIYKNKSKKNTTSKTCILSNNKRTTICQTNIKQNEEKQPIQKFTESYKSKRNKTNKWNTPYMERETWGQWAINNSSKIISNSIGMAYRNSNFIRKTTKWLSNQLQNRYRKQRIKISNRSRWQESQYEKEYIERQKERNEAERIKVESITFYKQGNNDKSFSSVIGDKERNQNYVTFYDLEINNHPSYFVENCAVHNCHQITGSAQEALLLLLENPPSHVIFILCTSEPEKLKASIRRRCFQCNLKPLSSRIITSLLNDILKKEKKDINKEIITLISKSCNGSPGIAAAMLDAVIDLDTPEPMIDVINGIKGYTDIQAIEICRELLNKDWATLSKLINNFNGEPESLRYAILGYYSKILLSNNKKLNGKAFDIISIFSESFIYTKKAGLVMAAYMICV